MRHRSSPANMKALCTAGAPHDISQRNAVRTRPAATRRASKMTASTQRLYPEGSRTSSSLSELTWVSESQCCAGPRVTDDGLILQSSLTLAECGNAA